MRPRPSAGGSAEARSEVRPRGESGRTVPRDRAGGGAHLPAMRPGPVHRTARARTPTVPPFRTQCRAIRRRWSRARRTLQRGWETHLPLLHPRGSRRGSRRSHRRGGGPDHAGGIGDSARPGYGAGTAPFPAPAGCDRPKLGGAGSRTPRALFHPIPPRGRPRAAAASRARSLPSAGTAPCPRRPGGPPTIPPRLRPAGPPDGQRGRTPATGHGH